MEAIPAPIQSLLDLFADALGDVRFADVDGQTLARAAAEVHTAATVMSSAQAALDEARARLQERQDALLAQAQRAVAYARVYAESDEALSGRLEAIALPRSSRRTRGIGASGGSGGAALVLEPDVDRDRKPRGRPRKVTAADSAPDALLFSAK